MLLLPMDPVTYSDRQVQASNSPQKQVVFKEPMVFYDSIYKSEGISFPAGVYELESRERGLLLRYSSGKTARQDVQW